MTLALPETGITKVVGLLEILHDHGDEEETVALSGELNMTLEDLLPVMEAAQMLGFITISGGKIKIAKEGLEVISSPTLQARKERIRNRVMALEVFKKVMELMGAREGKTHKKHLLKMLRAELPKDKAEKTFKRIVEWGRHAGIIGYDSDTEETFFIIEVKKK